MMTLNCEYVRDVYPDALHGSMEPELAARVREHVASCEECAAECAIVADLGRHAVTVPAGLHERVLRAAAQPQRHARMRPSQLAMAATLAAALIGGAVLVQTQQPAATSRGPAPVTKTAVHVGAVGVDAAMMTGKTSLDDLSVEQLQKLLGEIDS